MRTGSERRFPLETVEHEARRARDSRESRGRLVAAVSIQSRDANPEPLSFVDVRHGYLERRSDLLRRKLELFRIHFLVLDTVRTLDPLNVRNRVDDRGTSGVLLQYLELLLVPYRYVQVLEGLNEDDRVVLNPMDVVESRATARTISPEASAPRIP